MTHFHYAGKFSGNEDDLPKREHPVGYVEFKEHDNMRSLSIWINGASICILILMCFIMTYRVKLTGYMTMAGALSHMLGSPYWILGGVLALICSVPHEFLHAICFPGEVYMYQNLRQGMLFVIGPDDISKWRFVFISMVPNVLFGFIPFTVFLINPDFLLLGVFGLISISMGAGDYYNVVNTIVQMPGKAMSYFYGMHSCWYFPMQEYVIPYESENLVRTWFTTVKGERLKGKTKFDGSTLSFTIPRTSDYEIEEIKLKDARKELELNLYKTDISKKKSSLEVVITEEADELLKEILDLGYSIKYQYLRSPEGKEKYKAFDIEDERICEYSERFLKDAEDTEESKKKSKDRKKSKTRKKSKAGKKSKHDKKSDKRSKSKSKSMKGKEFGKKAKASRKKCKAEKKKLKNIRYKYKAKILIYDKEGNLVEKTKLKQCK